MKEIENIMEEAICKLKFIIKKKHDFLYYKGIKLSVGDDIVYFDITPKGNYYLVPRRLVNAHNKDGYELIRFDLFMTQEEYIKDLEHFKNTSTGLWATDRPDEVNDPKKLLFLLK